MYSRFFKRFLDFWVELIGLMCISPILLVEAGWLHFANKGAGAWSPTDYLPRLVTLSHTDYHIFTQTSPDSFSVFCATSRRLSRSSRLFILNS